MKFKTIIILILIIFLGGLGYYFYITYFNPNQKKEEVFIIDPNFNFYTNSKQTFTIKYPNNYILTINEDLGSISSKNVNESFDKLKKQSPEKWGEVPTPKIYFEVIPELPVKVIPEMEDYKRVELKDLEIYTGSVEPGIFESKNYFVKLKDNTFLRISLNPYISNSAEDIIKETNFEYEKLINQILMDLELL